MPNANYYFFGEVLEDNDTYSEAIENFVDTFLFGEFEANDASTDRPRNDQNNTQPRLEQ